ncbi:PAS domain S-box protein [Pelotomaculum isophthalicicum JI]|uniref:Stage 0 sporulation protein A homolog n=1 Tax=Pelotomaculum isophthalicicum JI TaxID=947010 RepID=A0A9X4JVW1_9FIRM|nr:PAS domain S-box protein [Pelotomaculum isophthalicicum]MDF9408127.1 PAS domain S-box protein [Pelotomaculum isophthalicicum JI]
MRDKLKILLVDDSKVFWMYLRKAFEESDVKAEITGALNMTSGISLIKNKPFDCIILDYMLPDGNGFLILQEMRASGIKTPVIVLTGHGDEQVAVTMMKAGANDYIPKSQISPGRLSQSIRSVIYSHLMEEHVKQVEKELKESKEFFESIVKTAKALIVGLDLKGFVSLFNYHCEEVTGWKKEDAIGKEWIPNFIPAKSRQQAEDTFKKFIDGNEGFEHESPILTIEGKERFIDWNYSTLQDSHGNLSLVLGIGVDVTDRKMMEEALRESEQRFRVIFEGAALGIALADNKGHILESNTEFQKMLGYCNEELRKMVFTDFTHPDDVLIDSGLHKELMAGERNHFHIEKRYIRKDGELLWASLTVSLVRDTNGNPKFAIVMVKNITEGKKAEESLRRRLSYEKLIANVSYIAASAEDIKDFLYDSLQRIGQTLDTSRILFWEYASDTDIYSNSYEWVDAGVPSQPGECQRIPSSTVPWFDAMMKKNEIINYSDTEIIPSIQEKELLHSLGVKSILAIPLYVNKTYHGFISFYQTQKYRVWPDEDIDILKTIVQIIAGTIERKGTENALRLSEDRYRSIFEGSKDTIYIVSKDGSFIEVNPAGLELIGYTMDELKLMNETQVYVDPSKRSAYVQEMQTKGFVKDYPVELKKKNGQTIYGLLSATAKKEQNGQVQFQGILRDITESKKAEEALREAHAQIKQLLASISSILIGVSSNELVNQWNTAAEKSFGITAGEVLGKSFLKCGIQWDWGKVVKHLDISKEKNLPVQMDDLRYTRPDGKDGLLRLHVNLIEDTAGRQWGYVLLGTDITEQKRIESQLALSQKMESIGQLAAGIAHEINTPMQYIGDNTRFFKDTFRDILDMLEKYKDILIKTEGGIVPVELIEEMKVMEKKLDLEYLTEETPRAIEQSLEGIDRVRKLILAMKDFSHPGRSEKSLSDINKAIESTVTISRNEWKYVADLETILDPGLPLVFCAIDQINQAVLNMIVNAAQAIKEIVKEGPAQKGKITIETSYSKPFIEITIRDTGKGIPQSIIHKIFDPFFTTKEVGKGTGQGLTISHDIIVNKHKGTIEVYSEVGKGTVFVIKLPVHSEEDKKQVL